MLNVLKIKDVICAEIKGIWGDEPTPGSVTTPVIKTNNMTYDGCISYDNLAYRVIPENKLASSYLLNGDILIEKSGGTRTHSVGYVNIFENADNRYVCNNFVVAIRPDKDKIIPKYLFYQMKHFYETGVFSDCYNKTTGIQNLKVSTYLDKKITCPDFTIQKQNVSFLDKVVGSISAKKEQLKQLDELVKSRFIEMFGKYFEDEKALCKLENICTATIGLTYKPTNISTNGTIVLRSGNIQNNELYLLDDIVRVSNIKINGDKYIHENDILMCSRNGSARLVGKSCLITKIQEPMSFGAFMTVIRCEYPYFLQAFFCSDYFKQQLTGTQTASVNQITTKMLYNYLVIKPQKDDENTFAEFVKQVDKSKFIVQKQIEDLQELLDSKMDEYFG